MTDADMMGDPDEPTDDELDPWARVASGWQPGATAPLEDDQAPVEDDAAPLEDDAAPLEDEPGPDRAAARRRVEARRRRARARAARSDRNRRRRRGRRRQRMSGEDDPTMTTIRWNVRRLPDGSWQGEVSFPAGAGEWLSAQVRDRSPGEAIEGAVESAADLCGLIDLGNLIPGILDTASSVVRSVAGRTARGAPPITPATTRLPGELSSLASAAAMRPGGMPYPGAAPAWGPPPMAPGYAPPPWAFKPAAPGYGAAPAWGGAPAGAWGAPAGWP